MQIVNSENKVPILKCYHNKKHFKNIFETFNFLYSFFLFFKIKSDFSFKP